MLAHPLQPLPQDRLDAGTQCFGEFRVRPLGERASDGIKIATAGLLFLGHGTVAPVQVAQGRTRRTGNSTPRKVADMGPNHREKVTFRPSKGCLIWASARPQAAGGRGWRQDVSYPYYCRGSPVFVRIPGIPHTPVAGRPVHQVFSPYAYGGPPLSTN